MKKDLNLLPKEVTSKQAQTNKTIHAIMIIGALCLVYVIGYPFYQKTVLQIKLSNMQSLSDSVESVAIKNLIDKYNVTKNEIKRDMELETMVNKDEMRYKEVLNAIEESIPVRVQLQNISISQDSETIKVSAIGTDELALADFWNNLRATKVFDKVEPKGITEVTTSKTGESIAKESTIELTYIQKG